MMERRPLPQTPYATEANDEFDRPFPGCTLTHLLTVVSLDQLEVAIEALSAIRALGGDLDALHPTRADGRTEHRLKVTGFVRIRPHFVRPPCRRIRSRTCGRRTLEQIPFNLVHIRTR